jgi:hypothetical protein
VLREEMGFQGVVCSDSLLMAGVRERFANEGEMALATLRAGVDLLLDLREPGQVIDFLTLSVESGALAETRVEEAHDRVTRLKQKVFGRTATSPPASHHDFARIAKAVATDAIEVLGESGDTALPFKADMPLVAILLKPFETAIDPPEQPLASALRERFRNVKYLQLGPNSNGEAYAFARQLAENAKQLLLAMIIRPAAWHAFGLRDEQREFVRQLTQARRDVVMASLGVPYALQDFPDAAVRICTYSDVPVSQQALAELLVTEHWLNGKRLPD